MITLGINAAFHDSASVLIIDGVPVAAAEEERFNRISHAKRPVPFSAWELPYEAIAFCLREQGLRLADVDHVAYSLDPARFAAGRPNLALDALGDIRLPVGSLHRQTGLLPWDSPWDPLFCAYMRDAPRQLRDGAPHHLHQQFRPATNAGRPPWRWHAVPHHLAHQASAFLSAPFERCAVMTMDGRGERATTCYGHWRDGRYSPLGEVHMPHSLGLLYEQVTSHLGFLHASDEYKVMALAAMGDPQMEAELQAHLRFLPDGHFELCPIDWEALAGAPRTPGTPLTRQQLNLAASVQAVLEKTVLRLVAWLQQRSGERCLALAGGMALNCAMNARLRDEGPFDRIWIQPAAGDAGSALGAALWVDAEQRARLSAPGAGSGTAPLASRRWHMRHAYLGPGWDDREIEVELEGAGLDFERLEDEESLVDRASSLLASGFILGWFQGRMEWGPRALGARSILASPLHAPMAQRLNELKDRDDFQPLSPIIKAEAFAEWFVSAERNGGSSPFMLFSHRLRVDRVGRVPAACCRDGSARVQTLEAEQNPRLHALLSAFEQKTGVPMLINTAFNVRDEPIACTPRHALATFFTTPLDGLVIGRSLLLKVGARQRSAAEAGDEHRVNCGTPDA